MGFNKPGKASRVGKGNGSGTPYPNDGTPGSKCGKCGRSFSNDAALGSHKCGRFDDKDDYGNKKG